MNDERPKPRLIQPSTIAELKAQNAELQLKIDQLHDDVDAVRADLDRQRQLMRTIIAQLAQIADPQSTTCPF